MTGNPGFLTVIGIFGAGMGGATSITLPLLSLGPMGGSVSGGGGGEGGSTSGILNVTSGSTESGLFPVSTWRRVGESVSPSNSAGSGVGT